MQTARVFKAMLMLGLAVSLLGAEATSAPPKSRGKKVGKARHPNPLLKASWGSQGRSKRFWLKVDPILLNSSDSQLISPSLSVSPWKYEPSFDENRVPNQIFEARCENVGCLTRDGQEDMGLESKPIFYQILVLRRVKVKKKQQHALRLERKTIRVGCTCTVPYVISQM